MKLAASSLHLQCTGAANRGACSAEHTRAILAIIEGATLTAVEKSDLMLYITEHLLSCGAWEQKDLSLLLNAVEAAHKPRRRPSQNFLDRMCDYFLEEEWQRWKAIGVQGMESSACELIQRLKSIGAKNLDEYRKKRVLSIWLLLRGDGRSAGVAGRAVAAEHFRRRLEKSMRDWEPQEYIAELPSLDVYQTEHRGMFAMAFPIDKPKSIPDADLAEVIFIDGLLRCRGGGNAYETQAFQFAQPQGLQLGQQGFAQQVSQAPMSVADMFQLAMQQFGLLRQQSAPHVELLAPRGRPMRALSNVHSQFPIPAANLAAWPAPSTPTPSAAQTLALPAPLATPEASLATLGAPLATLALEAPEVGNAVPCSDARDDVIAVAKRMLDRVAANKKPCDEGGNEDGDEGEEEGDCESIDDTRPAVKRKPSSFGTPTPKKSRPKEISSAAKDEKYGKAKLGKHVANAKAAAWQRKPSVHWETSRTQVRCRTGLAGKDTTHRFTFAKAGSAKKAWALGDKWLKIITAEYQAYHKCL